MNEQLADLTDKYLAAKKYAQKVENSRRCALDALNVALKSGNPAEIKQAAKSYDFQTKSAMRACLPLHNHFMACVLAKRIAQSPSSPVLCPKCGGPRVPHGAAQRMTCLPCLEAFGKKTAERFAAARSAKAKANKKAKETAAAVPIADKFIPPIKPPATPAEPRQTLEKSPALTGFNWQDASLIRCLRMAKESKSLVDQGFFFIITRTGNQGFACVKQAGPQDTIVLEVTARVPTGKTRLEWVCAARWHERRNETPE